jgi:hypothetical protein
MNAGTRELPRSLSWETAAPDDAGSAMSRRDGLRALMAMNPGALQPLSNNCS